MLFNFALSKILTQIRLTFIYNPPIKQNFALPPLSDVKSHLSCLNLALINTLDKFAPFIIIKKRRLSPWLDPQTEPLMNDRNKLVKSVKKHNSPDVILQLKGIKKTIQKSCK